MENSKALKMSEVQAGCDTIVSKGRTKYDLYYMALYSDMDKKINNNLLTLKFT